ncbi:MAG: hypothetical protein VX644_01280 [Planctomycetota bacterium]|nr:hypothetical protein [Planctomycetota bacterium]
MAHPKLVTPDQPLPTRCLLRTYEMCASLRLAVILIFSLAGTLAYATFVEAAYGTAAVQFFIYQTWWFNALNAMLAINIFCAAAIRFPWQRHQTGFVITHIGLLTLLFGALIGRFRGIDAQIPIYEDQSGQYAFDGSNLRFDISVRDTDADTEDSTAVQVHPVPFPCSPFNWDDFNHLFRFRQPDDETQLSRVSTPARLGWKMLRSATGMVFKLASKTSPNEVVFDEDDIKLEVVDFYSDSKEISVPNLKFKMSLPAATKIGPDGKPVKGPVRWVPVELKMDARQIQPQYPLGLGDSQMLGGGRVIFTMAGSAAHTKAFLASGPEGAISPKGQVVLFVDGSVHLLNVSESLEKGRQPLKNSSFQVEVTEYWNAWKQNENAGADQLQWANDTAITTPQSPVVVVSVFDKDNTQLSQLVFFANNPEGNIQDHENEIYGDLWFDFSQLKQQEASRIGAGDRLEFFQSHDHKLYYRYWKRAEKRLVFTQEVPLEGTAETAVNAFRMPIAQLKLYVTDFNPADKPGRKTLSLPFDRSKTLVQNRSVAKLRLTVNDQSKEEWVRIFVGTPDETPRTDQVLEVSSQGRTVSVSMPTKAIDIGFRIRLKNFERKLDPGTSQASHFSSWVDFLDRQIQSRIQFYDIKENQVSELQVPCNMLPSDKTLETSELGLQGQLAISPQDNQLLWTDPLNARLQRLPLGKLNDAKPATLTLEQAQVTPHPGVPGSQGTQSVKLSRPLALAVHPVSSAIYWVDQQQFHGGQVTLLYESQPDGKNVRLLLQSNDASLDSLAIAPSLQKIYWTDKRRGRIGRCNLDGTEQEARFMTGLNRPAHLVMDQDAKTLYWSEVNQGHATSRRAGLDDKKPATVVDVRGNPGTRLQEQGSVSAGEQQLVAEQHVIRGLAVDPKGKKLYWIQAEEHPAGYIGQHSQQVPETSHLMTSSLIGFKPTALKVPGLNQASSLVFDQQRQALYWNQAASYRHDIYITMNAPVEFSNPVTGATYRLFQESFNGPWKPGSLEYEQMVLPTSEKEELYLSVLTVNADPGRWIRNLGCLLVVLGIATMFYMRAYFFKPRRRKETRTSEQSLNVNPEPAEIS